MKHVFLGCFAAMSILSVVAWIWSPGQSDDGRIEIIWASDDNPVRREQIALFNRLYPKYRLTLDPQPGTMEKTIVQCLAGVGADVFDCYLVSQLSAFVRSGIARDCTDDMAARGVDIEATWPCVRPLAVYEGRVYGHPDNAHAAALWYNKRLFDQAGEPYPTDEWTWEEFIEVAKRLTRFDDRGRPVQFGLLVGLSDYMDVFIAQWGASIYTPEGTRSALDTHEAGEAMQFYQDLIHKHCVTPSPAQELAMASAGGWGQGVIALFGADQGAMAIGGRWWLCLLRREDFAGLPLGVVELPTGPSKRIFGFGRSSIVNAKGKNIEGALTFLEYMHGPAWNNLVNRQADALSPVMEYCYTEEFLHNPEHPEEDYNAVWRTAMENATPYDASPYVSGQVVDRILLKESDLVKVNLKSGAEAMRDAARRINEAIIEQLKIDPTLKTRYYEAIANGAPPAWDDPRDAP